MIIINNIMLDRFSKSIFCFNNICIGISDKIVNSGFIERENGIFLAYKKSIIEREKSIYDVPFWEYQVNRIDSQFDGINAIIENDSAEQIINNMFFLSKSIVDKFKIQFPDKKIALRLQYEFEFNIAKIFFHTIVDNIFCDNESKNLIYTNLQSDDENNIASLVIIK